MKGTVLIILILLGLIGNVAANRDTERQIEEGIVEIYIKFVVVYELSFQNTTYRINWKIEAVFRLFLSLHI